VSKETYYSVKRDLLQCQKRPITVSKETYYSVPATPTCHQGSMGIDGTDRPRVSHYKRVYRCISVYIGHVSVTIHVAGLGSESSIVVQSSTARSRFRVQGSGFRV